MSLPVLHSPPAPQPPQPEYGRALASAYTEMPRYLLAPEVAGLLHHVADWTQHAFINTLWNIGARLNEALARLPFKRRDSARGDPHRQAASVGKRPAKKRHQS